ncbi:flavin reductase family protein [Micromonospora sp. CA-246542]|uniref:flavin reductase family protein n=1 Tax=Micromonospora sp. CA-246542 TaxID=3239959 RepID=UPI003D94E22C
MLAEYRKAMGRYPTGVSVISTLHQGLPHGMTVNSFTSVSLDPLMLLFCASPRSRTLSLVLAENRFAVSVLAADQENIARRFSNSPVEDRFAGLPWRKSPGEQPLLDQAVAWFDCVVTDVVPGGDHRIVIATVTGFWEAREECSPLIFHRGRFVSLGAAHVGHVS